MNSRLSFLYECDCDDCKTQKVNLAFGKSKIKPLLKAVETAFKQLHKIGKYKPEDVAGTDAYKNLVIETSAIFESGISDNKIPEAMLKALKEDVFVFSALKTHAQLSEASKLLLDDKGVVKSFALFSNDVSKIKENYNQHYLEAEYQFAVSSAQSAGNWATVSEDYDLQYRTAGDSHVRDSHDKLRDTTLPNDDAFWLSYYPPNGWRCRCTAVQVRKGKYEVSDSKKAITEGDKATTQIDKNGKNKLEIFRFNPGVQKVVFPPSHPYAAVQGSKKVKELISKIDNPKESNLKEQRAEIKNWAKENIIGKTVKHPKIEKPILFTSTGIKEALNQPHKFIVEKNEAIKTIKKRIKEGEFIKTTKDNKGRDIEYHYLKTTIKEEDSFIVIKKESGNTAFHSLVEKIKE